MTSVRLPPTAANRPRVIGDCEWRIQAFVELDAYVASDHWITRIHSGNSMRARLLAYRREEPTDVGSGA